MFVGHDFNASRVSQPRQSSVSVRRMISTKREGERLRKLVRLAGLGNRRERVGSDHRGGGLSLAGGR
jgi:hypothetical protein